MKSVKWSQNESICPIHGVEMTDSGWSDYFQQNVYHCDQCTPKDKTYSPEEIEQIKKNLANLMKALEAGSYKP